MTAIEIDERTIFEMIETRFRAPEWAVLPGVASSTGAVTTRRCDAIAMSLWPSRGLELHGFEIKVSRADFLRELKNPEKAEQVAKYCDRWWLVTSDEHIVQAGELPPTWGLLVRHGRSLRLKVAAPQLQPVEMTRRFLAALLRVAATSMPGPKRIEEERKSAREEGFEQGKDSERWLKNNLTHELEQCQSRLDKLTHALGIDDQRALGWWSDKKVTRAVRFAMRFALSNEDSFDRIESAAKDILGACESVRAIVDDARAEPAEETTNAEREADA
jgi:hypothetical protein